ncbi:UNVERIFIED_CONTAM: hypothetical protein Sradi_3330800 [Sesamum radiatum]|uniref:Transposase-associated domain-containing protein n=1 Tax=Sesamum radiatum TaxID=300843 RepID=A0AAW2R270_SESRA
MYEKNLPRNVGIRQEFQDGVFEFINWAKTQHVFMDGEKIHCPCSKCKNGKYKSTEEVTYHLLRKGFVENYYNWTSHGEPEYEPSMSENNLLDDTTLYWNNYEQLNWDQIMVIDATGPTFPPVHVSHEPNKKETGISSNDQGGSFSDVISAADQPLYSGSENHSQLSAVVRLANIKSEYNLPQSCYDEISQLIGELLPRDHTLPKDYYSAKKLIRELGLPVEKIDACKDGCMLFWNDDKHLEFCKFCGHARYKPVKGQKPRRKRSAYATLRYLPITPRLQRLYMLPTLLLNI